MDIDCNINTDKHNSSRNNVSINESVTNKSTHQSISIDFPIYNNQINKSCKILGGNNIEHNITDKDCFNNSVSICQHNKNSNSDKEEMIVTNIPILTPTNIDTLSNVQHEKRKYKVSTGIREMNISTNLDNSISNSQNDKLRYKVSVGYIEETNVSDKTSDLTNSISINKNEKISCKVSIGDIKENNITYDIDNSDKSISNSEHIKHICKGSIGEILNNKAIDVTDKNIHTDSSIPIKLNKNCNAVLINHIEEIHIYDKTNQLDSYIPNDKHDDKIKCMEKSIINDKTNTLDNSMSMSIHNYTRYKVSIGDVKEMSIPDEKNNICINSINDNDVNNTNYKSFNFDKSLTNNSNDKSISNTNTLNSISNRQNDKIHATNSGIKKNNISKSSSHLYNATSKIKLSKNISIYKDINDIERSQDGYNRLQYNICYNTHI